MEQGSGGLLGAVAKEQGWHRQRKQFEVTRYWQLAFLWAHVMLWVPKEIPCVGIIHQTLLSPYYVAGRMLSAGARHN